MVRYDRHGRYINSGFGSDVDLDAIRHPDAAPKAGVPVRWVYITAGVAAAAVCAPALVAAIPPIKFSMLALWLTRCWVASRLWNRVFG